MSLADELKAASRNPETTAEWFEQWRATLDKADQKTVDDWLLDPRRGIAALWRVCRDHGYTKAEKTFRDWASTQRCDDR